MIENLRILASKFRNLLSQLAYVPRALKLVWSAAKRWTLDWFFLLALQGFLPVAAVYLTKLFVNSLVNALNSESPGTGFGRVLLFAVLMAAVMVMTEACRMATRWIQGHQAELVRDHIRFLIHEKSAAVDMAFYDSADFYDHLHRARDESGYRPVALIESMGGLLQNTLTLFAMAAVLIPFGFWIPLALFISTLPAFFIVLDAGVREHKWARKVTTDERRSWYYDWLLTSSETAAELRLFGLGNHFSKAYQDLRGRLREGQLKLARSQAAGELAAGLAALGIAGAAMVWMMRRVFLGLASLGDLALFYQAFNQGQGLMRSLLQSVGKIYANSLFLGNLFEFLDLEPKVVDPASPRSASLRLQDGIHFHDVTFHYPGARQPVLKNFSLFIPAGQTVAIVGSNGAGKSTLIKLLCRLYDPQKGKIEMDGVDLRQMNLSDLRRRITVLFQQPVHYNTTVQENIGLGDLAGSELSFINAAAEAAGADSMISGLPKGYATILGNAFVGGKELSVGQWQKIALARAFLRQAPLILLDEPTSAMDSWAETSWLERFQSLAAGRTVVMITHRFTTAMRADMIHVMDEGRILESGSHHELLAKEGLYAGSWQAQMKQGVPQYR